MATPEPEPAAPKAFISYSWDDGAHIEWVERLATRLREKDGVNVALDRWRAKPGAKLPAFMGRAVRENDFVIVVCTPRYKEKSEAGTGGVGYEGDIMTALVFTIKGEKKVIPVLRRGNWTDSAPTWLLGRFWIDLSEDPYSEPNYEKLLRKLHGAWKKAPPIGPRPDFGDKEEPQASTAPAPVTPKPFPHPEPEPPKKPGTQWPPDWYQREKRTYVPRPGLETQVVDQFRRNPGPRIVTLKAEGGMGKTRLAIECAGQVFDLFPDGVHFVSLTTTLPSEEAVAEAIGRALGLPAQACLPATVLDDLKKRTALLVLDNYESVDDPDHKVGRYLVRLVTEAHGLRLLVTGRSTVRAKGLEWIIEDLNEGMTPDEARALFLDQARQNWGKNRDLTAAEEPQWARILELTAKIPLAIELAAAWTGNFSIKKIADGLESTPLGKETGLPPDAIHSDANIADGRHDSLTRSLDWSYNLLAKPLQTIFATCGLFADSFDEPTLADIAGVPEVQDVLIRLTNASLIRRQEADDGSNRYRLHRFTREYARHRLDEDPAVADETRRRFVAHYARLAEENALDPNEIVRYARLDMEWRNALAASRMARSLQDMPSLGSMNPLGYFLQFRGLWSEAEFLYQQVLAGVRAANDKRNEGLVLNDMGPVYRAQSRLDEAIDAYAKALDISRKLRDRVGEAQALNNMGNVYLEQGRYTEALDTLTRALAILRDPETKDRVGEGQALNNMGIRLRGPGPVRRGARRFRRGHRHQTRAQGPCRRGSDAHRPGESLPDPGPVRRGPGHLCQDARHLPEVQGPHRRVLYAHRHGERLPVPGPIRRGARRLRQGSHHHPGAQESRLRGPSAPQHGAHLRRPGPARRGPRRLHQVAHHLSRAQDPHRRDRDAQQHGQALSGPGPV